MGGWVGVENFFTASLKKQVHTATDLVFKNCVAKQLETNVRCHLNT